MHLRFVASLVWVCCATAASVVGLWQQVLADTFVAESTEIDWHCVTVNVSLVQEPSVYSVTRRASLHTWLRPRESTVQQTRSYKYDAATEQLREVLPPDAIQNNTYWARSWTPDAVILTGIETPSLEVWTRDADRFFRNEYVDLLPRLIEWGYHTDRKSPVVTYTTTCRLGASRRQD